MRANIKLAGLALLCLLTGGTDHTDSGGWLTYSNANYAFSGCYPGTLFTAQGESADGAGQKSTAAGGAALFMFGNYVMPDPPLDNLHDEMARDEAFYLGKHGTPVLERLKPDYFVFSGYAGSQIVYEKTLLREDRFITLPLHLPKGETRNLRQAVCTHAALLQGAGPKPVM